MDKIVIIDYSKPIAEYWIDELFFDLWLDASLAEWIIHFFNITKEDLKVCALSK